MPTKTLQGMFVRRFGMWLGFTIKKKKSKHLPRWEVKLPFSPASKHRVSRSLGVNWRLQMLQTPGSQPLQLPRLGRMVPGSAARWRAAWPGRWFPFRSCGNPFSPVFSGGLLVLLRLYFLLGVLDHRFEICSIQNSIIIVSSLACVVFPSALWRLV